jgi:uncharacterized protein (TIGR02246 family)
LDAEREIADLVRRLIDAWNHGDADGFAGMCVSTAEYRTDHGHCVCGRDSIDELVRQASAGSPVSVVDSPSIGCDGAAATVRFGWAMAEQGIRTRRGVIACALVRQEAGWLIKALHNQEAAA